MDGTVKSVAFVPEGYLGFETNFKNVDENGEWLDPLIYDVRHFEMPKR